MTKISFRCKTREKLIRIFIVIQLSLVELSTGNWSDWGDWTTCSRTCGGGISYRSRKCIQNPESCSGESVHYKVCNPEKCGSTNWDIRIKQCSTFNAITYKKKRYRWRPHNDPKSPCSVSCYAEGGNVKLNLSHLILDGVPCFNKSDHVCLNGKCLRIGCDRHIGSGMLLDKCGICGGDGTTCAAVSEKFSWQQSDFSRCSVTCGIGVQHSTSICTDLGSGKMVDASFCAKLKPPKSLKKTCTLPACIKTEWYHGAWSQCSKTCGGGRSLRFVYCVEVGVDGFRRKVHDTYCRNRAPDKQQKCNNIRCPVWYTGEWSPCTTTCGEGFQYREVMCHHSGMKHSCDQSIKPKTYRKCSSLVPCRRGSNLKNAAVKHTYSTKPRFYTSSWSSCSVSCGFGVRTRIVECKVLSKLSKDVRVIGDYHCLGPKPHDKEDCFERFCNNNQLSLVINKPPRDSLENKDYTWRYAGFTQCSKTCMKGRQDSLTECVRINDRKVVSATHCSGIPGLPIVSRVCNEEPCPPQWVLGKYGNCSEKCGGGLRKRRMKCIYYTPDDYRESVVPSHKCGKKPYDPGQKCNSHPCPPEWKIENWSTCSVSCGRGTRVRKVRCMQRVSKTDYEVVNRARCKQSKPNIKMACHVKCVKKIPSIKKRKETFLQLAKNRKVIVRVGGSAVVIPRTTIIVKCPVRNFNRKLIYWLRNDVLVPHRGRVKTLRNGALRIRHSRSTLDAGSYTCIASSNNASIIIQFHSLAQAKEKAKYRESFLKLTILKRLKLQKSVSKMDKQLLSNSTNMDASVLLLPQNHSPVKGRVSKAARTVVVTFDWSACTKSCNGHGIQTRKLSCEELFRTYARLKSMRVCRKRKVPIPHSKKICHASNPCPRWNVHAWSDCPTTHCKRTKFGRQTRLVVCSTPNGNIVQDKQCMRWPKPATWRPCKSSKCHTQ